MTRDEFIERVVDWDDLMEFCWNNRAADRFVENVYYEDSRDDLISEQLSDMVRNNSWEEVRNWLDEIPTGYELYSISDWSGEWVGLDGSDFDDYKQTILDEYEYFDDDEEEEEEKVDSDGVVIVDECFEHPPITFEELFAANHQSMAKVDEDEEEFVLLI